MPRNPPSFGYVLGVIVRVIFACALIYAVSVLVAVGVLAVVS